MTKGLRLRSLAFHGPSRAPAIIGFSAGLNVIFGASNTGKSFIVDTIDYMLGGKGPLRDIPERTGYDQILLAIETLDGQQFTFVRSTGGGAFKLHQGLFSNACLRAMVKSWPTFTMTGAMTIFPLICSLGWI